MARSPTLGSALREPGALLDGALPNARKRPGEPGALLDGALPNARKRPGGPGALLDGALPNARKGPEGTRGAPRWRAPKRSENAPGNPGRSSMTHDRLRLDPRAAGQHQASELCHSTVILFPR